METHQEAKTSLQATQRQRIYHKKRIKTLNGDRKSRLQLIDPYNNEGPTDRIKKTSNEIGGRHEETNRKIVYPSREEQGRIEEVVVVFVR